MTSFSTTHEEIKEAAERLFAQDPDWVTFYREVFGLNGLIRQGYPTLDAMAEFEQTEAYSTIQKMLADLRKKGPLAETEDEPTKVITVRIPMSLHEALRAEAHEHQTSVNKLCISKLVQVIDNEMVPPDIRTKGGVRKRLEADL